MSDKWNVPCWGCKHDDEFCRVEFACWATQSKFKDYMFEPSDCNGFELIDAGISKSEALGMKLWEE